MSRSETTPESERVALENVPGSPLSVQRATLFEEGEPLGPPNRRPYSTTSSVYAEHTLSNPDNDQVIYCIGAILQAQIFDGTVDSEDFTNLVPEFDVDVQLPADLGGASDHIPEQVLNHEALTDLELREKLIAGLVPTVDIMYKFMKMMIHKAAYSVECNILALVYVTRITSQNKILLTMRNWRGLWISSILLAQKVWDDIPLRTASFAAILPNVTKDDLRKMEMTAFRLLDFNTTVKPSVYAMYYFELRELFHEISGGDSRFLWELSPLTVVQARKLEERSSIQGSLVGSSSSKRTPRESSSRSGSREPSATSTPASRQRGSPTILVDDILARRARFVLS